MNPNWNWAVGPACALIGMFVALYIKDKSREIAKLEFAELIKAVLATFKMELLREMDAIYVRAPEQKLHLEFRDDRLDSFDDELTIIRARISKLEDKVYNSHG